MNYSGKCNGCGLCCIIPDYGDCPNLLRLGNGLTKCKIYGNHKGTRLPLGYVCSDIMDLSHGFENCPYNEDKVFMPHIYTFVEMEEIGKKEVSFRKE